MVAVMVWPLATENWNQSCVSSTGNSSPWQLTAGMLRGEAVAYVFPASAPTPQSFCTGGGFASALASGASDPVSSRTARVRSDRWRRESLGMMRMLPCNDGSGRVLREFLAKLALEHLARRVAGQVVVTEPHVGGHLERCEALGHVGPEVRCRRGCTGLELDDGAHLLAQHLVR